MSGYTPHLQLYLLLVSSSFVDLLTDDLWQNYWKDHHEVGRNHTNLPVYNLHYSLNMLDYTPHLQLYLLLVNSNFVELPTDDHFQNYSNGPHEADHNHTNLLVYNLHCSQHMLDDNPNLDL